jgi:hypothetical protein
MAVFPAWPELTAEDVLKNMLYVAEECEGVTIRKGQQDGWVARIKAVMPQPEDPMELLRDVLAYNATDKLPEDPEYLTLAHNSEIVRRVRACLRGEPRPN